MRRILTWSFAIVFVSSLAYGQRTTSPGLSPESAARQQQLAAVDANREGVIMDIIARLRPSMDGQANVSGWDTRIAAALRSAAPDKVVAAQQAQTYADVLAVLYGSSHRRSMIPLAPGQNPVTAFGQAHENLSITPNSLGDVGDDVVFTPVAPCRIIDTRIATNAALLGRIGPNSGKQFQVNLADSSSQGGFAGSCGVPTTLLPTAIAINVTSTDQTGNGNIRVIPTGGGVPNISLLNYQAGVNIANAAVVISAINAGAQIFIYSGGSASQVVVDIMGYFAAPVATTPDNDVEMTTQAVAASATFDIFTPACPAGFRLTGGGFRSSVFAGPAPCCGRPVLGTSVGDVSGVNSADRWLCQGTNGATAQDYVCYAVCARIPGR